MTSEVFGLQQARSLEAEKAILYSRQLMLGQLEEVPEELRSRAQMEAKLREYLSPLDRMESLSVPVIPVEPVPEPDKFDLEVRLKGNEWLVKNPDQRPKDLWSPFRGDLAEAFKHRCGYSALRIPYGGSVDHFLSCKNHRELAYEWSNYRYCFANLNSRKKNADDKILDPFEVKPGWFEVVIPGFLLKPTSSIPQEVEFKAFETIKILALNGQDMIDARRRQYARYKRGSLTLQGLLEVAPLVGEAVQREGL